MKLSRRIKSSRANGARSRGPKTPEGIARSHTHAIRHGLLAKCVVLEGEDPEIFKLLMAEHEERYAPVDEVELGMIEEMASAYWRMRRAWTIEAELLNQGLRAQPPGRFAGRLTASFTDDARMAKLVLLQRYESRLHRMYQRAIDNLMMLRQAKQTDLNSEEPNPISERPPEPQAQQPEPVSEPLVKSTAQPLAHSPSGPHGPTAVEPQPPAPASRPKPEKEDKRPAA